MALHLRERTARIWHQSAPDIIVTVTARPAVAKGGRHRSLPLQSRSAMS
jgi:hypothetical protein